MGINSWDLLIDQIVEWQRNQFPDVTAMSSARHLMQETGEIMHDPNDAEEWADAFFIVLQGADRTPNSGEPGQMLFRAVKEKFEKNKARTWKLPDEHGVIGHATEGAVAHSHTCMRDDASPMNCVSHFCRCACGAWQLQSGKWLTSADVKPCT